MNSSQLSQIKGAKRILEDCACFQGPPGPTGAEGPAGPQGEQGPPGTFSTFTVNGASTNSLLYYDGNTISGMSSLFYYSSINTLSANLDIIPCTDVMYNLGSSDTRWNNIYTSTISSSVYNGIESYTYISTSGIVSSLMGLGNLGYISTSQVTSTVRGLGNANYISSSQLRSTVNGLATAGYISSSQLSSTISGLGTTVLPSTVNGLGNAGYISSSQLSSTISGLGTTVLPSTVNGLARAGYISTQQLQSTVSGLGTAGYISSIQLQSTVNGLATAGYISSTQLQSTVNGLGNAGYISSLQLTSTVSGLGTTVIPSTVNGLGNAGYISSLQLTSTVNGLGNAGYISSLQLTSTVGGLGNLGYVSSTQLTSTTQGLGQTYLSSFNTSFPSTVNGLATAGYISTQQLQSTVGGLGQTYLSSFNTSFPSTVNGLATAGYISTQQLQSTTQGLGQIYLSSIPSVQANASFGKVLRVDSLYGNDTTALTNQYSFPFSTISVAMSVASTSDMIYLLPGTYNETVVFRSTISIRGANTNSVTIQKANVTADTTLVKMNRNTRLEDVTLNLTSQSVLATKLIGVEISSCQTYAKLRTTVINVNNSGLTTNGTPTNLYGIYSSGHSSTLQYSGADDVERTTINVIGAGTGNKRCVYNDDSNRIQLRNCSLFCTDTMNASYTGGSFIGIETVNSNSIVAIKTSSVNGSHYTNGGTTSADVCQTAGQIDVFNSDLINRNANNRGVVINSSQLLYSMGVAGVLSNKPGQGGTTWGGATYLVPGTISFTGNAGDPITSYYPIRTPVIALLTTFSFQAATGPGSNNGSNISSFATLAVNGTILPQFTLVLNAMVSTNYLSTSTIRLGANDNFGVYLSTSQSNTSMTYPVVNLSLY